MMNDEDHGKHLNGSGLTTSHRECLRCFFHHSSILILPAVCIVLVLAAHAFAQGFTPVTKLSGPPAWPSPAAANSPWTAAGKDFYACFPSVVGSDLDATTKLRSLFIASRAPARVTVEVLATALDTTFIVTPGHYTRIEIPIFDALSPADDEVAVSKVIHIYSSEIISVYGYSHNALSSDGFVIYPTQALGTSYFAMSTRNAVNYKVGHGGDPALDTTVPNPRSEFAIVATQDNTTVTFTLAATSYSGLLLADSTYSIRLHRGQVYQLMARDTGLRLTTFLPDSSLNWWDAYAPWNGGPDCDLTGSYIISNKPIAVFSGHERATAPANLEYDFAGISRDHLAEEIMPVSAWGRNYVVTSLGQDSKGGLRAGGDAVRVLAGFDNTHVTINGAPARTLDRGQHADFLSGNAALIQSDQPILVADFMQSSNTTLDATGDPDLTLARPIEDYTNEYTLPPAAVASIYTEAHTLVICDSSAKGATLLNATPLSGGTWSPIAGTAFDVGIFTASPEEQRIESPLPCYAETFGYGIEDSYAFAGGGDFPYIDSLYAVNLNFHAVPVGQTPSLASPLHSAMTATDTVTIYNYEWISGDTSNFVLVGGLNQSASIAPGVQIPVPFQFRPTEPKYYTAKLRVWSDAVNPVFIILQGEGISPKVAVNPDTIDFGRVRLGTKVDSFFTILNEGTDSVSLIDLDYGTSVRPDFSADSVKTVTRGYRLLPPEFNNTAIDSVHFAPKTLGLQTGSIPIFWIDVPTGDTNYTPFVYLRGTGVEPSVTSSGFNFGSLRVDSASSIDTVSISNRGTDVTTLDSVTILDPFEIADSDFVVRLDTLPPSGSHNSIVIGYEGSDTALHFTVQFIPKSLGMKQLILRIHTLDAGTIYDTFVGRGVEPLVLVSPDTIDFGTINILPTSMLDSAADTTFAVSNMGTMPGLLDYLAYDTAQHFTVLLNQAGNSLNEKLDTGLTLPGTIQFHIAEEGDFMDTLFVANDTRYGLYPQYRNYQPAIILKAKVRSGAIGPDTLNFDTITTCDAVTDTVVVHNPFPVEMHIDSIAFLSDTAGFSLPKDIVPQISLPPYGSYKLPIVFSFPPDSLNGPQILKMGLFQRHEDGEPAIVDTVTAILMRKQRTFTLLAHLPTYPASANDVNDLKLPLTVQGPRAGVSELNSWTLSLKFSNDLFEPVGIDTANALAVRGDSTFTMTTHWDQATRTFTIVVTGSAVSDSAKIRNDLLLSILMRAYLTTDTVVTVTPTFTWAHHPCAYNLQSFTLSIPYGDDCGDPTIRAFMRHDSPFFTLIGAWPNPVDHSGGVSFGYTAAEPSLIRTEVFNETGEKTGESETSVGVGAGTVELNPKLLPRSGAAFLRVVATPAIGGIPAVKVLSVEVEK